MGDFIIGDIYVIESESQRKPGRLLKVTKDRVAIIRCLDERSGELRNIRTPLATVLEAKEEERQVFLLIARVKSILKKSTNVIGPPRPTRRPRVWHAP